MALGICSCQQGMDGSPCSHQAAVVLNFHNRSLNFIPTMHAQSRRHLAYIALGDKVEMDLKFYASLSQMNIESSNVTEPVTDTYGPDFSNSRSSSSATTKWPTLKLLHCLPQHSTVLDPDLEDMQLPFVVGD